LKCDLVRAAAKRNPIALQCAAKQKTINFFCNAWLQRKLQMNVTIMLLCIRRMAPGFLTVASAFGLARRRRIRTNAKTWGGHGTQPQEVGVNLS
jgi:hypothetical protein